MRLANSAPRFKRAIQALAAGLFLVVPLTALSAPVIEFYNTVLDNYFITADPVEAGAVDTGAAGPGWIRTGGQFDAGGNSPVCRFYGSISPGPNSHFYTVLADECAALKQLATVTPATQKRWNFESLDFLTGTPGAGATCPAGTIPVYRAYNNGFARGIDSNHRITTSSTAIQQVVTRGWSNEGVVMCAPGPLAAANCAALRSGTYRIITPTANTSVRTLSGVLDATTMILKLADGRSITWTAEGPCKFVQAGTNRFAVSPSGLAVWTSALFGTGMKMSLMLPEQTIQPAELAGTWNTLHFERDNDALPYDLFSLMLTISSTGSITSASECVLRNPCTPLAGPFPTFTRDASGGFAVPGEPNTRAFAFRAESGDMMFIWVDTNSVVVGTRTRVIAAPTVGSVSTFATLTMNPAGTSGNFADGGFTVTAVDAAAKTFVRVSAVDGHSQTLSYNVPRDGLLYRAAVTATTASGGTVNVPELYGLGLPGTGLSVIARPTTQSAAAYFGFSVTLP